MDASVSEFPFMAKLISQFCLGQVVVLSPKIIEHLESIDIWFTKKSLQLVSSCQIRRGRAMT